MAIEQEVIERIAKLEANDETIFHQINELKKEAKTLNSLATSVEVIATKMNNVDEKIDNIACGQKDIVKRIETVEREPSEELKHYKRKLIDVFLSVIGGGILGSIGTLFIK